MCEFFWSVKWVATTNANIRGIVHLVLNESHSVDTMTYIIIDGTAILRKIHVPCITTFLICINPFMHNVVKWPNVL